MKLFDSTAETPFMGGVADGVQTHLSANQIKI